MLEYISVINSNEDNQKHNVEVAAVGVTEISCQQQNTSYNFVKFKGNETKLYLLLKKHKNTYLSRKY